MPYVNAAEVAKLTRRIKLCDYLSVAQIYLQDNFLLERKLEPSDIKPRLLGHWGTCHGINVAYANFMHFFKNCTFIVGPGHGFPALQANLFLSGELAKVNPRATLDPRGLAYFCRNFSWPDGFPSHASPFTPGVITEGGELGYALANAYGLALGHPEKTIAVLIGDGELETATAVGTLNLPALVGGTGNGLVLPILHLNGYKISAPSIYARKSERELFEVLRGFGYTPIVLSAENSEKIQQTLAETFPYQGEPHHKKPKIQPFFILHSEKGFGGPNRHQESHQVPLKNPATNPAELEQLEAWLRSYEASDILNSLEEFAL